MTLAEEDVAVALYESGEHKSWTELRPILREAVAAFKKILKKDPNNVTAHFHLALIYLNKQQYQKALSHAERTRALNPKEPNIYLNIGVIYRNMDDTETGIKFYKKELARDPDNPDVAFNLGVVYFERHRWKTAAKYFEKSFQLKHRVDKLIDKLAKCYQKTGEVKKEIELYKRYLKLRPGNAWALQDLGAAHIDIAEYKRSLSYLKKAKKVLPDEPLVDDNIQKALNGIKSLKQKLT